MPFLSRVRPLIRTLFIFWMLGASAYAQSTAATAAIDGIVRNSAGEVVPNAMIALRDLSTGQVRSTVSGGDGAYRISALAVSTYEVTVDSAGFAVYKIPEVTLVLGQTTTLDITLQPAGVNASVEVSDKPLTIDSSQTASTTSIAQESIEELPVKDRNYLQFTLLAPGVAPSNTRSATGGGNISSSPMADSGFTFGGLRARSNSIAIDGLSNIDEATGASLIVLSPEIVREFQVINNGVSAEFGGAAGGTINVLTKTGSNVFHGTAFTFFQNQRLNARNPFDAKRRLFHTYQPGFSLGGPLRKDKLFFYVAAEQEHMIANDEPEINRSVRSSINAALAAGFAPRLTVRALQSTVFRVGTDQTELSGKLTYLPNSFNTVNVRFAYTNNRTRGDAFNTNILYDASARGTVYSKDYQVTGSVTSVVNPNLINDLRAQFSSRHFISRSGDETGPEIDIVGVARFGRPYESDGTRNERRQEFIDTITFIRGKHELKAGVSVNHVSLNSDLGAGFGGVYIFRTLNDFLTGSAAYWRQAFGSTHTQFGVTRFGAFVQDRWHPTQQLTLNLGLRYDVEKTPSQFRTDGNNVGPRLGFAWSPSTAWVVRGAFGLFYDRLPLAFLNDAIQKNGAAAFEQIAYDATASAIFNANGGGRVAVPLTGIAPSIYKAASPFHTPHSVQASVGVERLIAADTTLKAEFLFTRGIDLPRTRNVNLLPPVFLTAANAASLGFANPTPQEIGRPVFGPGRSDPRFDGIFQVENSARSNYRGLSLSVNRRFSKEVVALASYTLAKAADDASDFFEQPTNPFDIRAERSRSLLDVRHRLVLSGVFDLPFGDEEDKTKAKSKDSLIDAVLSNIEVAPIITLSSGRPTNPLTGLDDEHNGAFPVNSRPLGFARNVLTTPRSFNTDIRIVKYIPIREGSKLDFAFEFFNLFNHPTAASLNPYYGSNLTPLLSFHSATLFGAPRQFRFSLDLEF